MDSFNNNRCKKKDIEKFTYKSQLIRVDDQLIVKSQLLQKSFYSRSLEGAPPSVPLTHNPYVKRSATLAIEESIYKTPQFPVVREDLNTSVHLRARM